MTQKHWSDLIDAQFETKVGSEEDRWTQLRESFALTQSLHEFEEFDGLNH